MRPFIKQRREAVPWSTMSATPGLQRGHFSGPWCGVIGAEFRFATPSLTVRSLAPPSPQSCSVPSGLPDIRPQIPAPRVFGMSSSILTEMSMSDTRSTRVREKRRTATTPGSQHHALGREFVD
jgi:hypothetical protein